MGDSPVSVSLSVCLCLSVSVLAQSLVNRVRWGHCQTACLHSYLSSIALGRLRRLFLVTHLLLLLRLLAAKTALLSVLQSFPMSLVWVRKD